MDKYFFRPIVLIVIAISIVAISCEQTFYKEQNLDTIDSITLPKGVNLLTMGLNDTANNIKGKIMFCRQQSIDSKDTLPIYQINKQAQTIIHNFCKQVKKNNLISKDDTNYFYLYIYSITASDNIISVLFKNKYHFSGTDSTEQKYFSFNYDTKINKEIKFLDRYNINKDNISAFNRKLDHNYNHSYKSEDLKDLSFLLDKDTIWLLTQKQSSTLKIGIPTKTLKQFAR